MKINRILLVFGFVLLAGTSFGCTRDKTETKNTTNAKSTTMNNQTVTIKNSKGDVKIELYSEKAPKTVANFIAKAQSGFYDNLAFHRVESWVVQGGDPLGNGTGGGEMATELSDAPFIEGSVGVARGGNIEVSNDSQFFICTTDCDWLSGQYTNFGKIVSGMDVVKAIKIGDKIGEIKTD